MYACWPPRPLLFFLSFLTWALVGCAGGERRRVRDPLVAPLASADLLFAARLDAAKLDEAIGAYAALRARHPEEPRVLASLSRALYARARGFPAEHLGDLVDSREVGLACLVLQPAVAIEVESAGGEFTSAAAGLVDEEHAACAVWAGAAWLRWAEDRGVAGGAMDLPALRALSAHVRSLVPGELAAQAALNEALAWSLAPPGLGSDLERAAAAYTAARAAGPDQLEVLVDQARHQLARQGRQAELTELMSAVGAYEPIDRDAFALENTRAAADARALLAAPPPADPPAL